MPPISAASARGVGEALLVGAGRGGRGEVRRRARRAGRGSRPRPRAPHRQRDAAARRGPARPRPARGAGRWLTMNAPSATSKRAVVERQVLGVGVHELDLRVAAARLREHALGEVDAGDARAARGRGGGERARPAADVEHAHARADLRRVEQRLDRERGRARHQRAVGAGAGAPAVGLEGLEGRAVSRGRASSHGAAPARTAAAASARRPRVDRVAQLGHQALQVGEVVDREQAHARSAPWRGSR